MLLLLYQSISNRTKIFFMTRIQPVERSSSMPSLTTTDRTDVNFTMVSSWPIAGSEFVQGLYSFKPEDLPENESRECAICNQAYGPARGLASAEIATRLSCGHYFGLNCIFNHMAEEFGNSNRCPNPQCNKIAYAKLVGNLTVDDMVETIEFDDLQRPIEEPEQADENHQHSEYTVEESDCAPSPTESLTESQVNEALDHELRLAHQYDEDRRWQHAETRRIGAIVDHALYQYFLYEGVDLPPCDWTQTILSREQDQAMFEELRRIGAFCRDDPTMQEFGENLSDFDVYEAIRDRGLGWDVNLERWVPHQSWSAGV